MKTLLLSFVSMMLGVSLFAQNSATLKLNLEKNKVYRFGSNTEQTISQTIQGVAQTTNVKSNSTMSLKMMDATPDFIIAEIRFDTIISNTNAMGKISIINSAMDGNIGSSDMTEVMTCIMNRLSKNALFVKMDYSGKIIEIVNLKMLSDIVLKDTSAITGAMAPMIKLQLSNTINDKSLKTMIETITYNLPAKEINTGGKWDQVLNMNSGGMALDISTNYRLDQVKGNLALITAESNIQVSPNAEPLDYGGAKITYDDLKGMGKSNLTVDTKTGLAKESTGKTKISGTLNLNAQGMSMQIPMEIDIEAKVSSLN